MNNYQILIRIIGDNCVADDITEEDVRQQAQCWNEQELKESGEIAFSDCEINEAISAL